MPRLGITLAAFLLAGSFGANLGCRLAPSNAVIDRVADRNSESTGLKILEKIPGADLFGIASPTEAVQDLGLYAVTPFDPKKIPVVMIHGLISDPSTWDEMLEQLNDDPEIVSNYQFWIFLYRSENSILKSASDLRGSLQDAMHQLDPKGENARLSKMVLIGHSIGGLLAKFQVVHSDEQLWDAVSSEPAKSLGADRQVPDKIRDKFFFKPQPMISKVIYIGVPHGDAEQNADDRRRLGHRLLELPGSLRNGYRQLLDDDDSQLIDQESVVQIDDDPFTTESPILHAANDLRMGDGVTVHSIIGNAQLMRNGSPGDGLVSVASAKVEGSKSDWYVSAPHADLHTADDSIREVKRILLQHLSSGSRRSGGAMVGKAK